MMWLLLLGCVQLDNDGDGFPLGYDCDDENPNINAPAWWYADYDGDGFGGYEELRWCGKPDETFVTWTNAPGDCNDNRADIYPGQLERCDGLDEDCDDIVDEESINQTIWYLDRDNDGYGTAVEVVTQCQNPGGAYSSQSGDCDDDSSQLSPGRDEECDGIDNNCDGITDDGCLSYGDASVAGSWNNRSIGSAILVADDSDGPAQLLIGASDVPNGDWGVFGIEAPLDGYHLLSDLNGIYQVGSSQSVDEAILADDLNGDGWEDVMLSINCQQSNTKDGVDIYSGSSWPPDASGGVSLDVVCISNESFLISAPGDVDGDGSGELIVGYAYEGVGPGDPLYESLWVIEDFPVNGQAVHEAGFQWLTVERPDIFTAPEGGDFDGDGRNELILQHNDELKIFDGMIVGEEAIQTIAVGPEMVLFAENMLIDDFDGDGTDDIAVQAWIDRDEIDGDMVALVLDDPLRVDASLDAPLYTLSVLPNVSNNGRLQLAFASADEQDDGSELLVGAWTIQSDKGAVVMVPSGSTGALTFDESVRIAAGEREDDGLGSSLAIGDMNDDGVPDLLIGAPAAIANGTRVGIVYFFDGTEIF